MKLFGPQVSSDCCDYFGNEDLIMTSVSVVLEDRRRTKRQVDDLKRALEIQNTANEELELENEILKQGFDALREIHDTARLRFDPLQKGSKFSTWARASAFFQEIVDKRTKMKEMEDSIEQEQKGNFELEPKDAAASSELP